MKQINSSSIKSRRFIKSDRREEFLTVIANNKKGVVAAITSDKQFVIFRR